MFFIIIEKDQVDYNHIGMKALFDLIQITNIAQIIYDLLKNMEDCQYYNSNYLTLNNIIIDSKKKTHLNIRYKISDSFGLGIPVNSFFDLIDDWQKFKLSSCFIIKFSGLKFEIENINKAEKNEIIKREKDKFYYIEYNIKYQNCWECYININFYTIYILYDLFEDLFLLYAVGDGFNLEKIIAREIGCEIGLFKVGIKILDQNLLLIYNYSHEEDSIVISIDSLLKLIERHKKIENEIVKHKIPSPNFKLMKFTYFYNSIDLYVEYLENNDN